MRVVELQFSEQSAVQGWLKGSARAVRLVHHIFKNQDRSTGTLHLVCSDITCDYDAITTTYKKTVANGDVSQILEVQCGLGKVANADVENSKQSYFHGDLCRL